MIETPHGRIARLRTDTVTHHRWCALCLKELPLDPSGLLHDDCAGPAGAPLQDADRLTLAEFKLGKGWTILREVDGVQVRLLPTKVDRCSGTVWAVGWEAGCYRMRIEFTVGKDEPLHVFDDEVELYRGITQAEVNALQSGLRALAAGERAQVQIRTFNHSVSAAVYLRGKHLLDDSFSFLWGTARVGRKTTFATGGWHYRRTLTDNRQKYSRKINAKQFLLHVRSIERRANTVT